MVAIFTALLPGIAHVKFVEFDTTVIVPAKFADKSGLELVAAVKLMSVCPAVVPKFVALVPVMPRSSNKSLCQVMSGTEIFVKMLLTFVAVTLPERSRSEERRVGKECRSR